MKPVSRTAAESNRRALATPDELSVHLGVPPGTLSSWNHRGIGPQAAKVLRYRWTEADAWLDAQTPHHAA
jgi:hypothetical protein